MLRRHREHLTGLVEALQCRAAGIPPEPDVPVVEVVLHGVGAGRFRQYGGRRTGWIWARWGRISLRWPGKPWP